MREEIFGPVLPVVTYRYFDEALDYVNARPRPRPLSLYVFDDDHARIERVLEACTAGNVAVNDCVFQFAQSCRSVASVCPAWARITDARASSHSRSRCRCSGKHAGRRRHGCNRLTVRVRSAC